MIDTQVLGQQAARAMEYLDGHEEMDGGEIVSCLIAVVVQDANGSTSYTRTFSSDNMYYQQVGLGTAALECIKEGFRFSPPTSEEIGDDDDE